MKNYITLLLISIVLFSFSSCKKNDPVAEEDQEEVSAVEISFTEVEGEGHGDHYNYKEIENQKTQTIKFSGSLMLPSEGEHPHLQVGKSYRFNVKIKDFAGRETQQSFVEKADQHFAFLLGLPEGTAFVSYSDKTNDGTKVNVGVQGYLTILKESTSFDARYIMRHLNPGVKQKINTAVDWSNSNFASFTGANDLDLKFQLHFTTGSTDH